MSTVFTAATDTVSGFDVVTRLTARSRFFLVSARHLYSFLPGERRPPGASLDYAWLPNLKTSRAHVAGDHCFRSPCAVARHGGIQIAIVPHIGPGFGGGPLCTALYLSLGGASASSAPVLSYGALDYRPDGHVYYRPTGKAVEMAPGIASASASLFSSIQ